MRFVGVLLLVGALAGCGGGPELDALKSGVTERLAQALPAGTVALVSLERRGSQSDTKAPAGETRRIVYFDADLKLERDFDFGAWDSPGVAGLISALGAGPKGIVGLKPGGNKAGDVIRAYGTALYKREGDGWAGVASGAYRAASAPAYATNTAPQGPAAILEAIRKVVDAASRDTSHADRAIIEEELAAAHATIRARLARNADGYAIAAGPEHGQYLRFANALSEGKGARTISLVTRGGEENLRLLRDGKVSLALAQGDSALDAYEGKGNFAPDGPHMALRAIGSLYPEPVHVLVRADSSVSAVSQLKGLRVAIGQLGSASRTTALRVLDAHGIGLKGVKGVELALNDALVALRQKEVDAVIQVIGLPADSVRDALAQIPLRLLPLSDRAIAAMAAAKSGYFAFTIPPGTYATQNQPVTTIATAAVLLVGPELSDAEVTAITRFVFDGGRDLAARGSAQGAQISAATARQALPIPLHLAAGNALDTISAGAKSTAPASAGK
jgi:TRAP transporter TAXI family solute receptor